MILCQNLEELHQTFHFSFRPDQNFLETICYFPMVYWMRGTIESLDDLLRCGITQASNVVIVNKESSNAHDEEILADCNTIVAVQTIFRSVTGE